MALTRAGWWVAAGALGLVVAGRLLGILELHLVAAAAVALLVVAAVNVQATRLRLEVTRELHPPRVHAGTPSRVELHVTNRGRRRTPLLALRDPVGPSRSARVLLAPLAPGRAVSAAYQLPTDERGVVGIGPLRVEVSDPFGLFVLGTPAAGVAELTVWPAVAPLAPIPHTQGDEPHGGLHHRRGHGTSGQDFHALRPYVLGDDLRRVHWASTAKRDELMVRQDQMPWQGRATILLDARRGAYGGAAFERAVSAAASVATAASAQQFLVRLVTTAGLDTGFATGRAHLDAILEQLAVVSATDRGSLPGVVASLQRAGNGGAVAALVGARSPAGIAAVGHLGRSFGHLTVVAFGDGRTDPGTIPAGALLVDDDASFPTLWAQAVGARRPAARRPATASGGRR
jgi:uncharacterized protein (DUF58 family)